MLQRFYAGTYSRPILFGTGEVVQGRGVGIYALDLDLETGSLSPAGDPVPAPNPSYLAMHPGGGVLYAVNELKEYEGRPGGALSAYAVGPGGLRLLGRQPTHGADPCFVAVEPEGRCAAAADFSGSRVTLFPLAPDGAPLPPSQVIEHAGSSVDPQMQAAPHPHAVRFGPYPGRLTVSDLGLDRLFSYGLDADAGRLYPAPVPWSAEAPGSGPRHFVFDRACRRCYVIHELNATVTVLEPCADGAFHLLQTVDTVDAAQKPGNSCADLHLSPDGRRLYASNRGTDLLTVFRVGADGLLERQALVPCGGRTPRSFTLDRTGRFLLCANQDGDSVTVFRVGPDGGLTPCASLTVPTPVCVIPG